MGVTLSAPRSIRGATTVQYREKVLFFALSVLTRNRHRPDAVIATEKPLIYETEAGFRLRYSRARTIKDLKSAEKVTELKRTPTS
ncbi:hypothetical protein C0992_000415 [Termitomyces sp. T32_za158]|nr:hypothetical protein C0992_000415 [Termitomyces sp. T32_za158]